MNSVLKPFINQIFQLSFGLLQICILLFLADFLSQFIQLPTSILGLILCVIYCWGLGGVPKSLETAGNLLLKYMPLFFVPLVVAIPLYWPQLKVGWFACAAALFVSTAISIMVTAKTAQLQLKDKE